MRSATHRSVGSVDRYDVAVVGAGPVGCVAALAHAERGLRVLLLEQDPLRAADRAVGEWLHPPAMDVLDDLGVDLSAPVGYPTGKGFVIHPDDGTEELVLPYRAGRFGFSIEHGLLVETLRTQAERHPGVDYVPYARAVRAEADVLTLEARGRTRTARVAALACAAGAGTHLTTRPQMVGFGSSERPASHRIAGLTLLGAELPFEGYLHLCIGAPGPVMAYRIGPSRVRLLLDVPLGLSVPRHGGVPLFDAYAPALPGALVEPFRAALAAGAPTWSQGQLRPRGDVGQGGVPLLGDAAGSLHPLTAVGLTLGIGDAATLAETGGAAAYRKARRRATRVPETVAIGLTELFSDSSPETIAIRRATYRMWRDHPRERLRSMGFLAGDGDGALRFGRSCLRVMLRSAADVCADGARSGYLRHAGQVGGDLLWRMGWMVGGSLGWTEALPGVLQQRLEARRGAAARFGGALSSTAEPQGEVVGLPTGSPRVTSVEEALERGAAALLSEQAEDGSFEGEVGWCPMLAAQYVLACHVMDRPLQQERRRRLLQHFDRTRLASGTWGLHEKAEPNLSVTALVYAAARLLGLSKDDPRIAAGRAFLRAEGGAVGASGWAKLWLALVGLYEWEGVRPVPPELWGAPRWLPMHPSRMYPHTRLIYLGMAAVYGERVQRPPTPVVRAVRDEIFVSPYDEVDFAAARDRVRAGDVQVPPNRSAEAAYRALIALERAFEGGGPLDAGPARRSREDVLGRVRERIRYELRSTSHTCISPVSGLLDVLALWWADPDDPDVAQALLRFEGWIWEDDVRGARVCSVRSITWDTALSTRALTAAAPFVDVADALRRADAFLQSQQIRGGTGREPENDRVDPTGGYCHSGAWHGWPASDCTAEAVLARLESPVGQATVREMTEAVRFILRTQNSDGGFGSYEAQRGELSLDWMKPSRMFAARMTERSSVETTASCVAALARFTERYPDRLRPEIGRAMERAVASLRSAQRPDGSFEGVRGVHSIYGTFFGVRGLLAGGVPCVDPQIRRACGWLAERQRPDGGWGEHFSSVAEGRYVEHEEGQVVQTAWALVTLLEAREPDFALLDRAARFLARAQRPDGSWAKQDPAGIFFGTALLDYGLYRRYFPAWALALYQRRVAERERATLARGPKSGPAAG